MKITKQLLKQIIREEIDSVLEVEMDTRRVEEGETSGLEGMKYRSQKTMWDEYCEGRSSRPNFNHPDGEGAQMRCVRNRVAKGLGR